MARAASKVSGLALLELLNREEALPHALLVTAALDLLEAVAEGRTLKLCKRKAGSRFALENVQVAVRGRSKVVGRGNRSGLQVLIWEVLAGQRANDGSKLPPLSAVRDDVHPDVESVIESAVLLHRSLPDARSLHTALTIASAGMARGHRELGKRVSATAKPSPAAPAKSPKAAPPKSATEPASVDKSPKSEGQDLDDIVGDLLAQAAPDGWDSWNLAPSTRPPNTQRLGSAVAATKSAGPVAAEAPGQTSRVAASDTSNGRAVGSPQLLSDDDLIDDVDLDELAADDGPPTMRAAVPPKSAVSTAPPDLLRAAAGPYIIDDPSTIDGDDLVEDITELVTTATDAARSAQNGLNVRERPVVASSKPPPLPAKAKQPARPDAFLVTPDQFTEAHLAGALRRAGYVVETATDPKDALERVCVAQPRCVIFDLVGDVQLSLADECRTASPRACLSPFVFIWEQGKPRRGKGRLAKHDIWLHKPFTVDELVAHVGTFAPMVDLDAKASVPPSVGPPAGTSALDGDLHHISMRTLAAMIGMERRSGVLRIRSGERAAKLIWKDGKATQGTVGTRRMRGSDALKTLIEWETGRFTFEARSDVGADGWLPGELDRPTSVSTRRPEPS